MYIVKYIENGEEKEEKIENRDEAFRFQSELIAEEKIENRDEAFRFQSELIAKRKMKEDGTWDIEIKGVWNTKTIK